MQWTTCWKSGLSLTHERTDPTFAVFKQFEPFHHGGVASVCFTISLVSRLALVKPESTIVNIFNGADETRWNDRAISGIMTVINVVIGMAIELDYWLPSCASCQNGKQRGRCESVLVVVINFFRGPWTSVRHEKTSNDRWERCPLPPRPNANWLIPRLPINIGEVGPAIPRHSQERERMNWNNWNPCHHEYVPRNQCPMPAWLDLDHGPPDGGHPTKPSSLSTQKPLHCSIDMVQEYLCFY